MTEMTNDAGIPKWDTADRMRKAARQAGIAVGDMAEYMGVSRNTVGNWINGHVSPSTQTLRLWAMRCGVSYDWLRGGGPSDPGWAVGDSNPEPTGYGHFTRLRLAYGATDTHPQEHAA